MITATSKDSLLILVPALNEEGAVGGVVRAIRESVPGAPVLVVDDCSTDGTIAAARAAGAEVLAMPHHLGLGGCVQAGYKLAFELGFEYVIRLDGDGQHDARDIPRIYETLRRTDCHMVIGSRFAEANGSNTSWLRAVGIHFLPAGAAARSGQAGASILPPVTWASIAKRCRFSAAVSAGVSRDRSAGGAAAQCDLSSRKCRATCIRAAPAAPASPR